jgi:predicted negative regulator of RcsB-dependent stress response
MTEEYLTDDEQLEHVKQLAAEYGPWMIGAVVMAMIFVFGWRYYEGHRNERALQAAGQFGEMSAAIQHNDRAKARQIAAGLIKDYAKTPYADQAKLTLARLAVDDGQDTQAIAPLSEVMNNSQDAELRHIARLRLARVLIDEGKPDDALKTLDDAPGAFAARYHEVRGDAFVAKKDLSQAAAEYKAALGESSLNNMDSALLELKIADLGQPTQPAASVAAVAPAAAAPAPSAPAAPTAAPSNKAKP